MVAESLIKRLVRPDVLKLKAYHVPDSGGMVKLDAMESPYDSEAEIREGWLEALSQTHINRYPDAACVALKAEIRQCLAIPDDYGLMLGNGSDELIQTIAILLGGADRTFMSPSPSFSMYQQISLATSTSFSSIALRPDFGLDLRVTLDLIVQQQPACIFLAFPNNPTGNCFDASHIRAILEAAPGMVVLDEAYHAFCGKSYMDQIQHFPNLVVLRTLSKSGLAGLRLGMLVAGNHWVEQLEKLRLPYNINTLTQASVAYFLKHYNIIEQHSSEIVEGRTTLQDEMQSIPGITVYPSETNFLLFHTSLGADRVYDELKSRGVLIKNLHGSHEALDDCLRVTVSCPSENRIFIAALKAVCQ